MDPPCTSEGVQCNTSAGTGGAISWLGENWGPSSAKLNNIDNIEI